MRTPPPEDVLEAFGVTAAPQPLDGGRGLTWRAGPIVLKPVDFAVESQWRSEVLDTLPDAEGFRIPRPIRADTGDWLHSGWEASQLVAGATDPTRWNEAIEAGTAFHEAIAHLDRPTFLDDRDDWWSRADRVSWEEGVFDDTPVLRQLMEARRPVALNHQVVHGDLLGNVLYEPGLPPAVIDWPPYWRPASWAAAVAVVDALCWHGAGEDLIEHWSGLEAWPQMLLRAMLYRMITDQESTRMTGGLWQPHPAYRPAAKLVLERAAMP